MFEDHRVQHQQGVQKSLPRKGSVQSLCIVALAVGGRGHSAQLTASSTCSRGRGQSVHTPARTEWKLMQKMIGFDAMMLTWWPRRWVISVSSASAWYRI